MVANLQYQAMKGVQWVNFYGDEIPLVWMEDRQMPGVVLVNICELLGLDYSTQFNKVAEGQDFFKPASIVINGRPTMVLPINKINSWLFRINPNRVSGIISRNGVDIDKQSLLIKYQEECSMVLSDYWIHGVAVNARPTSYLEVGEDVEWLGPVAASRPRLLRSIAAYCDYLDKSHGVILEVDNLIDAIKNIYGKFIDIQVVNHPELAAQGKASGRELWQLALMENATADFLRKNVIQDMHPEDVLDAIEDYIVKTLANLGAHFIRIRDTWNYGNGLELGRI